MDITVSQTTIHWLLLTKIRCFYQASFKRYSSPHKHRDLIDVEEKVSKPRVARLMKAAGIASTMAKRFVITTDSKNTKAPAPDRIKRAFDVAEENTVRVADTTSI
jgi:putative transposase